MQSGQSPPDESLKLPVALQHRDAIIEAVRSGKVLREIAASLGVKKQSLHVHLVNDPEYRDALVEQADSMIDEAKEATWEAKEQTDIARAREITRFAFRYAESVNPAKWSPRQQVDIHGLVSIDQSLDGLAAALLDKMRVVSTQEQPEEQPEQDADT